MAGIILVHVHFPEDHLLFFFQLVRRQRGMLHNVAEHIHRHRGSCIRCANPINGAVEGGISVHVPARLLHFLVDAAGGTRGGAFEQHVLQDVGQPRAQPLPFVDAAGHAPGLGRNHRRAMVFANDQGQAIVERLHADIGRNRGKFDRRGG